MGVNTHVPTGATFSDTGTTTDDYADALSWLCSGLGKKQIWLKNTHATNGLKYTVTTCLDPDGLEKTFVSETTLAAGSTDEFILNNAYGKIVVQVKAAVGSSQATYQIDLAGGRA